MTQPYKKKLIEIAIPLEAINVASAREKSIRHGHPSTLHLWWARRPLAACRAVLFAQLVDDPSSLPDKFPTPEAQEVERKRLFAIMEDLVKWENSTNEAVLERARNEIRRSCGGDLPPIYDPFSGGASIPLEAQRLGLPAYGSDLNPVAVMIGKAMIEIPPQFCDMEPIHPGEKGHGFGDYKGTEGLAEDIEHYGNWMHKKAFERIGHLYPKVKIPREQGGGEGNPIAWVWVRTVPSPDPAFRDAGVPVASNFLMSSKKGQEVWLEPIVNKMTKTITFEVHEGGNKDEIAKARRGTKSGQATFRCLFSDAPILGSYIDEMAQKGLMGRMLMAVVVQSGRKRLYVSGGQSSQKNIDALVAAKKSELSFDFLNAKTRGTFASNAQGRKYEFDTFADYFTERQLVGLGTYLQLLKEVQAKILEDIAKFENERGSELDLSAYSSAVTVYLAFGISRLSDIQNSLCMWEPSKTQVRHVFTRPAIPMMWDFAEAGMFSGSAGDFSVSLSSIVRVVKNLGIGDPGSIIQHDAQTVDFPPNTVISTDPPYYHNVMYSDLSDFFYVWLRGALKEAYPNLFSVLSTPKTEELVAHKYRHGGSDAAEKFFLEGMTSAVGNLATKSSYNFPTTIFYAFKQSEIKAEGISSTGWATFLQAVIQAGYAVVGTWPLRTEMANRMIASGTNALANSVVLVCRKKEATAEVITRAEFIRALKRELPSSIAELQGANVSPADMPQSAIGPGMGVFSRYKAVLEADDGSMTVKTALQIINAELDEFLNSLHGDFDPDTRFAVTWFEQNGYKKGDFGSADSLARARGISVESVKHAGIIDSAANKVRILQREELDPSWDPNSNTQLTIWECCQYLVRDYEEGGETAAAILLKKIGYDRAEAVKDLAYYLYDVCSNKRQNAKEATSYNGLISGWNDITRMAETIHDTDTMRQASLF